jgi:hypothetical protein
MRSTIVLLALALTGCFAPSYRDGDLVCADGPTRCPDGYYCAVTKTCWRNGHAPPRPPIHITAGTGGAVDVTAAGAHQMTISVGQPLVGTASATGDHTLQLGLVRSAVSK